MGASKGSASRERKEHRKGAVIRKQAAEARGRVLANTRVETFNYGGPFELEAVDRGWQEWPEPRPNSEERARFWALTFGAIKWIYWILLGGLIAIGVLAIAFVGIMKTAGY
jgi:hypothetical protein